MILIPSMWGETKARYSFDNSADNAFGSGFVDIGNEEALKEYWLHESYMRTDWDGDGIAELRKVCSVAVTSLLRMNLLTVYLL